MADRPVQSSQFLKISNTSETHTCLYSPVHHLSLGYWVQNEDTYTLTNKYRMARFCGSASTYHPAAPSQTNRHTTTLHKHSVRHLNMQPVSSCHVSLSLPDIIALFYAGLGILVLFDV